MVIDVLLYILNEVIGLSPVVGREKGREILGTLESKESNLKLRQEYSTTSISTAGMVEPAHAHTST